MRLTLPNVTLVMAETRAHELARLSLIDTLRKIEPEQVIVHTDCPSKFDMDVAYVEMPDLGQQDFNTYVFLHALTRVSTKYVLFQEWDSGVHDTTSWTDEFLEYDYIGAPWDFGPQEFCVGNGGFSLRTKALSEAIALHKLPDFPKRPAFKYSDHTLCRVHRPFFEGLGFRWAPRTLAQQFSVEDDAFTDVSFGYHCAIHWPRVMERDELLIRCEELAKQPENGPSIWYRKHLFDEVGFTEKRSGLQKD